MQVGVAQLQVVVVEAQQRPETDVLAAQVHDDFLADHLFQHDGSSPHGPAFSTVIGIAAAPPVGNAECRTCRKRSFPLPTNWPPAAPTWRRVRQFGFDTEFVGEDTYHPRLCLVQAAAPDRLFLIDPLSAGPLDAFWRLVVDPGRVVVVHAGREEVRLCRLWTGQTPGNLFDLQIAAGLVGLTYPLGHGPLVGHVVGVHLAKGETRTEWRHRPLTPEQIRYAFDDVRYLLAVWKKLSGRLEKMGRTEWAREEFERLMRTASPGEPAADEKWRKLRGLGSLDRRRLAAVRALYHWREETAAQTNRPARSIVRDDLIVEIARRNPTQERDLQVVRGLPKRDLEAIVETVALRPRSAARRVPGRDGARPGPAAGGARRPAC